MISSSLPEREGQPHQHKRSDFPTVSVPFDDVVTLYEDAPCGYISTAPDGTIVRVNRTFLNLTGYKATDLVGVRTFAQLLTAGGRIYHETHFAPMLQMHGHVHEIALDVIRADGSRLPALVNSVLERDGSGRPISIRTAVFDATFRREYERELLRAKERAERSERLASELARALQATFIPPPPPDIVGLDIAAVYRSAGDGTEVGGDFYDVFEIAPDDLIVVIGDVSGKGVHAAVVTALARHTIRASAVRHLRPSEMLATLNEVLLRDGTERFCTVALLRLRRVEETWAITMSLGGHPLPMLISGTAAPRPVGRAGTLIGSFPDPALHDVEYVLQSGDSIVLFTDGITEGRRDREFYGEQRLEAVLRRRRASAAELCQALVDDVLHFQRGEPRDDIAVVTIHVP